MMKRTLINLGVLLLSVFLMLAILEAVLRVSKIQPGLGTARGLYLEDPYAGFRLKPNFEGLNSEKEYQVTLRTNANGFRANRDYAAEKPEGIVRVAVLGDSFTEGSGVQNGETFPDVMQEELGASYEVLNMGVGNYGTVNEVAFLKHYGLNYHPDVVILAMFLGNDIVNNNSRIPRPSLSGPGGSQNPSDGKARLFVRVRSQICSLIKSLYAYQFISKRFYALLTAFGMRDFYGGKLAYDYMIVKRDTPDVVSGWKYTRSDLQELKEICRQNGARLIVVLIPLRDQVIDDNWDKIVPLHPFYDRDKPQRILNGILRESNMDVVDLLPLMRKAKEKNTFYYQRDIHCTSAGYRFIGETISRYLKATLLAEKRGTDHV
jgi:hypothetical protein